MNAESSSSRSTVASSLGSPSASAGRMASHKLAWGLVVRSITAPIRCGIRDRADSFAIQASKQPKHHLNVLVRHLPHGAFFRGK
jgi:hypothetical protein